MSPTVLPNVRRAAAPRVKERLHGLEWLRAVAALLVVLLHAGIPYLTHPMPGLVWSTDSVETSGLVDVSCWTIDGFIMPLFFLMTGFFAARLYKQRGANGFLKHRVARIGGPLLLGMVLILPLDLYAWLLGWVGDGRVPFAKLRSLKVEGELGTALWGLSHLWFLAYVLTYCAIAWGIHHLFARSDRLTVAVLKIPRRVRIPSATGLPALLASVAIMGAVLWWQPRIVIGFRHGWLPFWENLVYYAVPFGLGWAWERQAQSKIVRRPVGRTEWSLRLTAACAVWLLLWPRLQNHLEHETLPVADALVPGLFALFAMLASTSLFALALSMRFERSYWQVTYIAQASFWIYLLHHPLVGLTHVSLARTGLSPVAGWLATAGVATAICLVTYEVWVRRTWIGWVLNGRRDRAPGSASTVPDALPERRRAA